MKIIRVFPRKTEFSPRDKYCFFSPPPAKAFIPEHDEVHICCLFTWDKQKAEWLKDCWQDKTKKPVKLSGPAYDGSISIKWT